MTLLGVDERNLNSYFGLKALLVFFPDKSQNFFSGSNILLLFDFSFILSFSSFSLLKKGKIQI